MLINSQIHQSSILWWQIIPISCEILCLTLLRWNPCFVKQLCSQTEHFQPTFHAPSRIESKSEYKKWIWKIFIFFPILLFHISNPSTPMLRNRKIYDKLEEEDILDSAGTLSQHFHQFSCSQTKMSFLLHSKRISRSNRRYPTYFPSFSVKSLSSTHSQSFSC